VAHLVDRYAGVNAYFPDRLNERKKCDVLDNMRIASEFRLEKTCELLGTYERFTESDMGLGLECDHLCLSPQLNLALHNMEKLQELIWVTQRRSLMTGLLKGCIMRNGRKNAVVVMKGRIVA
jgi:hypothetical protein